MGEGPDVRAMQQAVDEGSIAYPPQITAQQAAILERALLARLPAGGAPARQRQCAPNTHTRWRPNLCSHPHSRSGRTEMTTQAASQMAMLLFLREISDVLPRLKIRAIFRFKTRLIPF